MKVAVFDGLILTPHLEQESIRINTLKDITLVKIESREKCHFEVVANRKGQAISILITTDPNEAVKLVNEIRANIRPKTGFRY